MNARLACLAGTLVVAAGCGAEGPLIPWTPKPTPHERYVEGLRDAHLDEYALGRAWLAATESALGDPETVTLPLHEVGYIDPATPAAIGYRFDLRRGRVLEIDVTFEATGQATAPKVFLDLFLVGDTGADRIASAEEGTLALRHVARRDGSYILRLQPELLAGGRYTITQRTESSLRFPVDGAGDRNVQSVFGDARDGGRRSHHGIDIFAPRGTPVLAAADGFVRSVSTTEIGGRVIWLSDTVHGQSIYYAHLDDWAVEDGKQVKAGDVLGFVGNTGNARNTPPHLHFGIYSRGPVDPLPFVRASDRVPAGPAGELALIGEWGRVARVRATLLASPGRGAATLTTLGTGTAVHVTAATGSLFRVQLPDGRAGYVDARAVLRLTSPLQVRELHEGETLLSEPSVRGVMVEQLTSPVRAGVLAAFEGFALVDVGGRRAWVRDGT